MLPITHAGRCPAPEWSSGPGCICLRGRHCGRCSPARQRMSWHQFVRVPPARQRLDPIKPCRDVLVCGRDVEAEFLGRIVEVADEREVRDGRTLAEDEGALGE